MPRNPARPCLGCGKRTRRKSGRCQACDREQDKTKGAKRKAAGQRTGSTRAWRALRYAILQRDGFKCVEYEPCSFCGGTGRRSTDRRRACARCAGAGKRRCERGPLHVDHIKPKARGGTDDPSNLRTLCKHHNLKKGDR